MRRLSPLLLVLACCATSERHPTQGQPITACVISCASGHWGSRIQHICVGRTRFQDINITGEDNDPQSPSGDLWLTGLTSYGADFVVQERLTKEGTTKGDPKWLQRYSAILKDVQREMGDDARASYLKGDTVLMSCQSYIASKCGASDNCGIHPGEEDLSGGRAKMSPP